MGVITASGSLTAGPQVSGGFPTVVSTAKIALSQESKGYGQCTGTVQQTIAFVAYAELSGVGPGETVTKADTLYFRASGPVFLRLTCLNGAGVADTPVVLPCAGLLMLEFQSGRELVLLEAKGSGTIEYLASGSV
jgi:hypothetical protein